MADLDVYNNVRETSKADDVSAPLSGVFQTGDGTVYAFSPAGDPSVSNTVLVSEDQFGNVTVAVNGTDLSLHSRLRRHHRHAHGRQHDRCRGQRPAAERSAGIPGDSRGIPGIPGIVPRSLGKGDNEHEVS